VNGSSSIKQQVMTCPACHQALFATFSTDVQLDMSVARLSESGSVDATVTVTGMQLDHDCIPRATRSHWDSIGR
jgi:hypothetical protein